MADNDIYGSKEKYERFKSRINFLDKPPEKGKYYCKNMTNLSYFEKLFARFEAKDLSYVRRLRLSNSFLIVLHCAEKDLNDVEREDIDKIIGFMHSVYKSPKSKSDFIRDIKYIWKIILPEIDIRGRPDERIVPYVVRHLSGKIERAKERIRNDRMSIEELEKIIEFFSNDIRMQCYLSLAVESIARPQEILYRKIKDVELNDNYAIITISDHSKTGTGLMQCIDSYPLLIRWLEQHPFKNNPEAFLFINIGQKKFGDQLTPFNINKKLKIACKALGIPKNITCYSLKRNGVTFRRLRGESDMDIQHAARWTSTKQLKTYDMSTQQEALKIQLIKRGLVQAEDKGYKKYQPENKECQFCHTVHPFASKFCDTCKRPLDRKRVIQNSEKKEREIMTLKSELKTIKNSLAQRKPYEEMIGKFLQNKDVQALFQKMIYEES